MPRITIERQNTNPLWWTGEKQILRKNLVVRIPPISERVKAVIARKLSKRQPSLALKSSLEAAQHKAIVAKQKLDQIKVTLNTCLEERERALADVADTRTIQLHQALKEMDVQMRNQFEEELCTKEQKHESICEEMELRMLATIKDKQREIDQELNNHLLEEEQASQVEAEPPSKRTKLDGDVEPALKGDANQTEVVTEEYPMVSTRIEEAKRDIETARQMADVLEETKKQMVWLLKQVIKAEAQQKIAKMKLKASAAAALVTENRAP